MASAPLLFAPSRHPRQVLAVAEPWRRFRHTLPGALVSAAGVRQMLDRPAHRVPFTRGMPPGGEPDGFPLRAPPSAAVQLLLRIAQIDVLTQSTAALID